MIQPRAASGGPERLQDDAAQLTHEDALPPLALSPVLSAADTDFISGLRLTIDREVAKGQGLGGLLEQVSLHLERFEQGVVRAGVLDLGLSCPAGLLSDSWGPVRAKRSTLDGNTVEISGPGPIDRFEVTLSTPEEAIQTVSAKVQDFWLG